MVGLLETGAGFWDPLLWLFSLLVIASLVYIIRSLGERGYKKGTGQATTFFSGNPAPDKPIGAGNIYWGFFEAMSGYYKGLRDVHTGLVGDYIYLFTLILSFLLMALTIGGLT